MDRLRSMDRFQLQLNLYIKRWNIKSPAIARKIQEMTNNTVSERTIRRYITGDSKISDEMKQYITEALESITGEPFWNVRYDDGDIAVLEKKTVDLFRKLTANFGKSVIDIREKILGFMDEEDDEEPDIVYIDSVCREYLKKYSLSGIEARKIFSTCIEELSTIDSFHTAIVEEIRKLDSKSSKKVEKIMDSFISDMNFSKLSDNLSYMKSAMALSNWRKTIYKNGNNLIRKIYLESELDSKPVNIENEFDLKPVNTEEKLFFNKIRFDEIDYNTALKADNYFDNIYYFTDFSKKDYDNLEKLLKIAAVDEGKNPIAGDRCIGDKEMVILMYILLKRRNYIEAFSNDNR